MCKLPLFDGGDRGGFGREGYAIKSLMICDIALLKIQILINLSYNGVDFNSKP
jgi:hypothetical protein